MIRSSLRIDHRIVMTHGDLHPRNIMVAWGDGDGGEELKVTSILDWEFAGWYREYWEFLKALNTIGRAPLHDWVEYLPTEAIGIYPSEYAMDCILDRCLGYRRHFCDCRAATRALYWGASWLSSSSS